MQFMENYTDRQAAEVVRTRIDWKYVLSLELTDPGFDFSVLLEFRSRLLEAQQEELLLEVLLEQCEQRGWLKARGKQRTDSTHMLAAIRNINRLEYAGETLRAALNSLTEKGLEKACVADTTWKGYPSQASWNTQRHLAGRPLH